MDITITKDKRDLCVLMLPSTKEFLNYTNNAKLVNQ